MEAKQSLLRIGCIGLGVVSLMAAAVWNSAPVMLEAAQDGQRQASAEPAIAPSPPPIRADIRSSRHAKSPSSAVDDRNVAELVPAAPPPSAQLLSAPAPSSARSNAPLPTGGLRTSSAGSPHLPAAPLPSAPLPSASASAGSDERPSAEFGLAKSNQLRSESAGEAYPATGQPTVSQTALLRASDAQPGGPDGMLDGNLLLIEAHEVAGEAEVVDDYTRIISLCNAGIQAGVGTEAVQFAHQLISWAYNRRGEAYEALGDTSKALVDFHAAVEHDPTRWQAVHNRGVSLAQAGRLREALEDFSRTIQLRPRHAKAYSNRGAISEQQGKLHEALKDFQRASELDHRLAVAHAGIGRTLLKLGRLQEALIALDEAIALDAENPAYVTSRGDVYAALGEYESALSDYGKAIEVDPSFATAYRNGSWLLATCPDHRFRDQENALIGAQKALDLAYGERHLSLDALAAAHANAGDFDQALQIAERAIEEAPQGVRTFYEARRKLYEQGKPYRTQPVQHAAFVEAAK